MKKRKLVFAITAITVFSAMMLTSNTKAQAAAKKTYTITPKSSPYKGKYKKTLVYELTKEEGPDHNKSFEVCVKIGDEEIGRGLGRTKKAAEQVAAYHGICRIK